MVPGIAIPDTPGGKQNARTGSKAKKKGKGYERVGNLHEEVPRLLDEAQEMPFPERTTYPVDVAILFKNPRNSSLLLSGPGPVYP